MSSPERKSGKSLSKETRMAGGVVIALLGFSAFSYSYIDNAMEKLELSRSENILSENMTQDQVVYEGISTREKVDSGVGTAGLIGGIAGAAITFLAATDEKNNKRSSEQ